MSLPTWVQLYVDKENAQAHLLSQREKAFIDALSIALDALKDIDVLNNDAYNPKGSVEEAAKLAQDAMRRIAELGDEGPKKTNNLTYEDTI